MRTTLLLQGLNLTILATSMNQPSPSCLSLINSKIFHPWKIEKNYSYSFSNAWYLLITRDNSLLCLVTVIKNMVFTMGITLLLQGLNWKKLHLQLFQCVKLSFTRNNSLLWWQLWLNKFSKLNGSFSLAFSN